MDRHGDNLVRGSIQTGHRQAVGQAFSVFQALDRALAVVRAVGPVAIRRVKGKDAVTITAG